MRRDEKGQAIVEYMLMLVLVVGFVTIIAVGFKKSILHVWESFSRDISAACPHDCPPDPRIRFN